MYFLLWANSFLKGWITFRRGCAGEQTGSQKSCLVYTKRRYSYAVSLNLIIHYHQTLICNNNLEGSQSCLRSRIYYRESNQLNHNVWKRTYMSAQIRLKSACASRTVWLESSLYAWGNFASLAIKNASSKDSDQTAKMRRLIGIFADRTFPKVRFVALLINWFTGHTCIKSHNLSRVRKVRCWNTRCLSKHLCFLPWCINGFKFLDSYLCLNRPPT